MRFKKTLAACTISLVSALGIRMDGGDHLGIKKAIRGRMTMNVQSYVERNLDAIIAEQNSELERFGFKVSEHPKIVLAQHPMYANNPLMRYFYSGVYEPMTDELFIPPSLNYVSGHNLLNLSAFLLGVPFGTDVKKTIRHELGHQCADQYARIELGTIWPTFPEREGDRYGMKIVSEGIGKFFEDPYDEGSFTDDKWPSSAEKYFRLTYLDRQEVFYQGGRSLVNRILLMHGKKGLFALMKNPPTQKNLACMPCYRQELLKKITGNEADESFEK